MTCGTSSAQTRDDARVNEEREEAQVMIACGFDVHRAQVTFDPVERGELPTSWIPPAHLLELRCRVQLRQTLADERRAWLQRVHAQLFHHGIPVGGELAKPRQRDWLRTVELSPAGRGVVEAALATV